MYSISEWLGTSNRKLNSVLNTIEYLKHPYLPLCISEQSYQEIIKHCLQSEMDYNLTTLMEKLKAIIGLDDDALWVYIKDSNGNYLEQNIKSNIYFHPKFGFCLTLDTKALNDFLWVEFYLFDDFFENVRVLSLIIDFVKQRR